MNSSPGNSNHLAAAALGLVAAVYLWLAFGVLPVTTYWSPDNGLKRIQAENVRWTPTLDLSIHYPGQWLDPERQFFPLAPPFYFISQTRVYLVQTPIIAILSQPFINLLGSRGERVLPLLAGLICVVLVGHWLADLGGVWQGAGLLLTGLATPVLIYSQLFWEHTLALALGLGALTCLRPTTQPLTLRQIVLAGVLGGLAASIRKDMLLFTLVTGGLLVWDSWCERSDKLLARNLSAGAGSRVWPHRHLLLLADIFGVALVLYAWLIYPWASRYFPPELALIFDYFPSSYIVTHGWASVPDFILAPDYGWPGGVLVLTLGGYWLIQRWPHPAMREALQCGLLAGFGLGLGYFIPRHLQSGLLHGLLSASPFLALALGATASTPDMKFLRQMLVGFLLLYVAGVGGLVPMGPLRGGVEWGMRYALIAFPLGVVLAVRGLQAISQRARQAWLARAHLAIACGLMAMSVGVQGLGLWRIATNFVGNPAFEAQLLAVPEKYLLTNQAWLTPRAPTVYGAKEIFLVTGPEGWVTWLTTAYAQGVRHFAFMGNGVPDAAVLARAAPPGGHIEMVAVLPLPEGYYLSRFEIIP